MSSASLHRIIPFAIYMAFLILVSGLDALHGLGIDLPSWWDMRWLYAVKVTCVLLALTLFWRHYGELHTIRSVTMPDWILSVLAGIAVFILWINLDVAWLTLGESKGFNPTQQETGQLDWALICVRWIGAALIVPVMEELFWRSYLMRWINRSDFLACPASQIGIRALFITAVLFGLEHTLWFAGIIAGLVYGWLYIRSGNLWTSVVSHGVTNGLLGIWVVMTGNWQFW